MNKFNNAMKKSISIFIKVLVIIAIIWAFVWQMSQGICPVP
ncbi:MAG TPA: hypothetical protein VLB50_05740 [Ignavibacteriaceae bacterium]|nr:hypothetical protein [Ignavibacteriaceae bacterium]